MMRLKKTAAMAAVVSLAAALPPAGGAQDAFQAGLQGSLQQLQQLQQDFHRRFPQPDYRSQRYLEERIRYLEQRLAVLEEAVFRGAGRLGHGDRFSRSFTTQGEMTESWAWDAVMRAKRETENQNCRTSEPTVERRGGSFYGTFTYDCLGR